MEANATKIRAKYGIGSVVHEPGTHISAPVKREKGLAMTHPTRFPIKPLYVRGEASLTNNRSIAAKKAWKSPYRARPVCEWTPEQQMAGFDLKDPLDLAWAKIYRLSGMVEEFWKRKDPGRNKREQARELKRLDRMGVQSWFEALYNATEDFGKAYRALKKAPREWATQRYRGDPNGKP